MIKNNYLFEEYKLAHQELMLLWQLFWKQASYFLTINGVFIAFISTTLTYSKNYLLAFVVSIFGLFITILWLFHGNRSFFYVRTVEEKMREIENNKIFAIKLKQYQSHFFDENEKTSYLESYSGSYLRNRVLPTATIIVWIIILMYVACQLIRISFPC